GAWRDVLLERPAVVGRGGGGGEAGGQASCYRQAVPKCERDRAAGAGGGGKRGGCAVAGEYFCEPDDRCAHAQTSHRRGVWRAFGSGRRSRGLGIWSEP